MKTKLIVAVLFTSCLFGCSEAPKQQGLYFYNDMETIKGWANVWGLTDQNKNSGEYALKLDTVQPYSYGFKIKIKDISKKPVRKVKYSGYCLLTNTNAKGNLVFSISGVDKPNIFWLGLKIEDKVKEANKWGKISGEVDLSINQLNNPENTIDMYFWNTSKEIVFADDFELEFIE